MPEISFWIYLAVTAGITYLVRAVPLILVKGRIKNRFILSFLHYIPYAVLSVMTVPAIFYATGDRLSAVAGFAVAVFLALMNRSLLTVAAAACGTVLAVQAIQIFL
jgi:branched-subunit amino acid transport protein